jgi:hypothetical protein
MLEHRLAIINNLKLDPDFPESVGFIALLQEHLLKMRITGGRFMPPRFFGYYFRGEVPIGVAGPWTILLTPGELITTVLGIVKDGVEGYQIQSANSETDPPHVLVHDMHSGICSLWNFEEGIFFVEASEPFRMVDAKEVSDETNTSQTP